MKTTGNTHLSGKVRKACVSGSFYPDDAKKINSLLARTTACESHNISAYDGRHILGGIVPHAGMVYCARQAVHFFEVYRKSGQQPDSVLIAHPNHGRWGPAVSTDGHDCWETPLGALRVDHELADEMKLPVSAEAQEGEHSAEVLLPYLQYFLPEGFRILPVNMLLQDARQAAAVAKNAHAAARRLKKKLLFLASSDFSHFLTPAESQKLDDKVLEKILNKDAAGVEHTVKKHQITVCGSGPVMALMEYARMCNPGYSVRLLSRGHSGEVVSSARVVNYVSIMISL